MPMFIGDVHNKIEKYLEIVRNTPLPTFQVGDFGYGFCTDEELREVCSDPKDHAMCGNHDNRSVAMNQSNYLPSGHFEDGMFFIGGAESSDRHRRKENVDWWSDEEHSFSEMFEIGNAYYDSKPDIVVSHDCPFFVAEQIGSHHSTPSKTSTFLHNLFEVHRPNIWIFGHHHKSFDRVILGTRFICLAELETIII